MECDPIMDLTQTFARLFPIYKHSSATRKLSWTFSKVTPGFKGESATRRCFAGPQDPEYLTVSLQRRTCHATSDLADIANDLVILVVRGQRRPVIFVRSSVKSV